MYKCWITCYCGLNLCKLKSTHHNYDSCIFADLLQITDKLYHIMLYTSPWSRFELTTSVVIGIDCAGSCKSNSHMITGTMAPYLSTKQEALKTVRTVYIEVRIIHIYVCWVIKWKANTGQTWVKLNAPFPPLPTPRDGGIQFRSTCWSSTNPSSFHQLH